jgi:calcineurin-like phosphoesterase family protein
MSQIFISSDWHLHHFSLLNFKRADGTPVRSFSCVEEMDEHLIERHNAVVKPSDHFYNLGDVVMDRKYLNLVSRFNGHKRLVRGNHDIFRTKFYMEYFDEIYGSRVLDNIIFTHIPIHPNNMGKFKGNCHGHIHQNSSYPGKYINVSVENLDDYTPISLEDLKLKFDKIQDLD